MKPKNRKKLDKIRKKHEQKQKALNQQEVDFDTSAYVVYNNLQLTYPCLSFDILNANKYSNAPVSEESKLKFPLDFYMVAGAQTPPDTEHNFIYVVKVDNIHQLDQEDEDDKDEDEDDDDNDDGKDPKNDIDDEAKQAKLNTIRVPVKGNVNRIRANKISGKTFTATWTDKGKIHINDITIPLIALNDFKSMRNYQAQKVENKPVFSFGGHLSEGYAIDWSPVQAGTIASGDCKKNIHIWTAQGSNNWNIDQQPLVGHLDSVEDIKWSPIDQSILTSCSVDKSIRIWDLRLERSKRCVCAIEGAHSSDVNVLDWNNRSSHLLISGGDDGVVKIWDTRKLLQPDREPKSIANFCYHNKPITSVEWNPNDDTVFAVSCEDDKVTLWDLAVERDEEQERADLEAKIKLEQQDANMKEDGDDSDSDDEEEKDDERMETDETDQANENVEEEDEDPTVGVPEQMLFLHQGQYEIKEIHWHPQINGLLISSALNGFNIFKTISA